jgi:pimeloyl-ACP methyl ester carboxylesterase
MPYAPEPPVSMPAARTVHGPGRGECFVRDSGGVLRELGTGPAVVAGYSMGGPIARLTTRRHPDAVRALVLRAVSEPALDVAETVLGQRDAS